MDLPRYLEVRYAYGTLPIYVKDCKQANKFYLWLVAPTSKLKIKCLVRLAHTGTGTAYGPYAVLLIGIVLKLIRIQIRISMFTPIQIQIRIRIGTKTIPIHMRILLRIYTCWKIRFFYFWSRHCHLTLFYLSHQCQMCHMFSVFWTAYWNFLEKSQLYKVLIGTDPDPAKWCGSDPIRIWIHDTGHMTTLWQEIINNNL